MMDGFTLKYLTLFVIISALHQAFGAELHRPNEEDEAEFSMSTEEKSWADDGDASLSDDLCVTCGRIEANLTVTNGGPWGDWGHIQLCPSGSYAVGYNMKIERKKHLRDNTALNAIKLLCEKRSAKPVGSVTSTQGHWGSWVGAVKCQSRSRERLYLTAFDLQVQPPRKGVFKDDTAANYVKFKCRDYSGAEKSTELVKPPGHGHWGSWGAWSADCPDYSAICGIQTKVEKPRGFFHDDTALNDVKFYCCI